jgi:hypothetical protein
VLEYILYQLLAMLNACFIVRINNVGESPSRVKVHVRRLYLEVVVAVLKIVIAKPARRLASSDKHDIIPEVTRSSFASFDKMTVQIRFAVNQSL